MTNASTSLLGGTPAWVWWTGGGALVLLVLFVVVVWLKGRPFAEGAVFRASRLSDGNRLLPTQVLITARSDALVAALRLDMVLGRRAWVK